MYVQIDQLYPKPIYLTGRPQSRENINNNTMNRVSIDVVSTYGTMAESFPSSWIKTERSYNILYDCLQSCLNSETTQPIYSVLLLRRILWTFLDVSPYWSQTGPGSWE